MKAEDLPAEPSMSNTAEWDSYNALVFVSEVEQAYQIQLETSDVLAVRSLSDIGAILKKKGVEGFVE